MFCVSLSLEVKRVNTKVTKLISYQVLKAGYSVLQITAVLS